MATLNLTANATYYISFEGILKEGSIIRAYLTAVSDQVVLDGAQMFDNVQIPSIESPVIMTIAGVAMPSEIDGDPQTAITCDSFTITATSDHAVVGSILLTSNGALFGEAIFGYILTGAITSLATGESITINFNDIPWLNTMILVDRV